MKSDEMTKALQYQSELKFLKENLVITMQHKMRRELKLKK